MSLKRLAATLTGEGAPPPAGGHQHGHHILNNTAYIGRLYYGKYQRITGKTIHAGAPPRAEWTEVPVPPIVDQALFDAAQAQLAHKAWTSRRNCKYAYLMVGGRLRCGQCGRSLSGYLDVYGHGRYRCTLQPYQDEGQTHTKRSISARSTASGLEQEIAHHEAEQRRLEQTQVEVAALQDYCARVRANLQHCTMEEKQRALEALDIRVTWHPEKPLEIRGSIPLVEHFVSPCQAKPLVDGKVEADKTAVRTVSDAG